MPRPPFYALLSWFSTLLISLVPFATITMSSANLRSFSLIPSTLLHFSWRCLQGSLWITGEKVNLRRTCHASGIYYLLHFLIFYNRVNSISYIFLLRYIGSTTNQITLYLVRGKHLLCRPSNINLFFVWKFCFQSPPYSLLKGILKYFVSELTLFTRAH